MTKKNTTIRNIDQVFHNFSFYPLVILGYLYIRSKYKISTIYMYIHTQFMKQRIRSLAVINFK